MSRENPRVPMRSAAWRVIAAVVLAVLLPMRAAPAQQPAARANGAAHAAAPVAPVLGRIVVRAPVPQSGGGSGLALGGRALVPVPVPVHVPAAQPPVLNRGILGGASFTKPATALLPLGGPAKPAATGINGTSIRPKH